MADPIVYNTQTGQYYPLTPLTPAHSVKSTYPLTPLTPSHNVNPQAAVMLAAAKVAQAKAEPKDDPLSKFLEYDFGSGIKMKFALPAFMLLLAALSKGRR